MRDPEFQDHPDLPLKIQGEDRKPKSNLWQRLSRGMEVVIFALLLLSVFKLFGPELDRQDELTAEIDRLAQVEAAKQKQVIRLRQEHRLLKTDKDYLESVARDRLELQRPDEYIFRIDRGKGEG